MNLSNIFRLHAVASAVPNKTLSAAPFSVSSHRSGITLTRQPVQLFALCLVSVFLLLGCQPIQVPTPTPTDPNATPTVEPTPVVMEGLPPVLLRIPDLSLELPVTTMGWVVTEVNGQRTTQWIVPLDSVGWHANSAGAGGTGNTILSGHQNTGAALFAPLALGDITVDQVLELVDEAGTPFRYRVTEVSEPIPLVGATEEDNALAQTYIAPTTTGQLTLITGWPDFTTTHRIFAVAELLGAGE
ncbi:MAG: class F sortase [Caldilineaceae bacterium]|nr:class F sortase [Caldilineaceae bacterium]